MPYKYKIGYIKRKRSKNCDFIFNFHAKFKFLLSKQWEWNVLYVLVLGRTLFESSMFGIFGKVQVDLWFEFVFSGWNVLKFQAFFASSRCVTIPPLCPTPIWRTYIISEENSCFYLLSCLDIEIHPVNSELGASSDSGWWHLTGDILVQSLSK